VHHSSDIGGHIFHAVILVGILYFIWRTVRRNGGVAALRARFSGPSQPAAPTHPGVIALRDTMTRLDGRLARVETYVTTREFDLQRKFRELDTQ
jgi:hypothetical protein